MKRDFGYTFPLVRTKSIFLIILVLLTMQIWTKGFHFLTKGRISSPLSTFELSRLNVYWCLLGVDWLIKMFGYVNFCEHLLLWRLRKLFVEQNFTFSEFRFVLQDFQIVLRTVSARVFFATFFFSPTDNHSNFTWTNIQHCPSYFFPSFYCVSKSQF